MLTDIVSLAWDAVEHTLQVGFICPFLPFRGH